MGIAGSKEGSNKAEIVDCCDTGDFKNRSIPVLQNVSLWQILSDESDWSLEGTLLSVRWLFLSGIRENLRDICVGVG